MPSSINSTSSSPGGLISTGATDNELVIQTDDTTAISIDASQNVSFTNGVVATGSLEVNGTSSAGADIKLYEDTDNGTNYVALKSPDVLSGNFTFTLPNSAGSSGQVLSTDGSGNLSWVTRSTTTYDGVSSYVWAYWAGTGISENDTIAGSSLQPASAWANVASIADDTNTAGGFSKGGGTLNGTWQLMGRNQVSGATSRVRFGLFVRIS